MNIDERQIDAREWERQEAAWRALRGSSTDADVAYRRVMQALREPPVSMPPAGFAAAVARRAEIQAGDEARFERRLAWSLGAAFLVAALIAVAVFGRLGAIAPAGDWLGSLRWVIAAAACLGVTAVMPKPRTPGPR